LLEDAFASVQFQNKID